MSEILKARINLSKITFRRMKEEDINSVLEIERALFSLYKDAWNYKHFLFEIEEHEFSISIVAEYKGELIAYAVCWAMFEEFHIANIGVTAKYQRMGLAEYLMKYLERELVTDEENMILEVRTGNIPAIRLYEKVGFKVFFERKNFYSNGENAYVMIKLLKDGVWSKSTVSI